MSVSNISLDLPSNDCLLSKLNMMNKSKIQKNLTTIELGKNIFAFDTLESTNTYSKTLNQTNAPHGTLVITEEQTGGRGRLNRRWIASAGENLLFSVILYPDFDIQKAMLLSFVGALAVTDAIESVTNLSSTCKWPNDILINGKKVCGILLESTVHHSEVGKLILGIGLNVNQTDFPDDLRYKATSLRLESGKEIDRIVLLQKILEELENRYTELSHFPPSQIINDWKMKALIFGKKITVLENEFSFAATAIDVNEDGSLMVQTEDGSKKNIVAGDVSLSYS